MTNLKRLMVYFMYFNRVVLTPASAAHPLRIPCASAAHPLRSEHAGGTLVEVGENR